MKHADLDGVIGGADGAKQSGEAEEAGAEQFREFHGDNGWRLKPDRSDAGRQSPTPPNPGKFKGRKNRAAERAECAGGIGRRLRLCVNRNGSQNLRNAWAPTNTALFKADLS